MISGVLQANNGCSSVDALQVRIKTGDPKIGSPQTVDKSPTLEIRCRAFSMRKNVVKH